MLVCINEEEPWILSEFVLKTERHTKVKNCAAPQQQKGDSDKGNLCCHFKVLLAYSALVL